MSILGKNTEKVYLLLDIGSGSMTISLTLFSPGNVPVFLYTIKKSFVITDSPDSSKLFDNMTKTLDELLTELVKKGFEHDFWKAGDKHVSGAVISFSSPWFMPKTKYIEIKREKPFEISESFLDDIIIQEESIFKDEILKENKHEGLSEDSFEIVEKSIVHTKVNGYALSTTVGHLTKSFEAYLCMSTISSGVIGKIHDLILKHTHIPREKVIVHTFPVVSFSVLRDIFSNHNDFLLIDITSEITDLTLVKNDVLSETASFPSGKNFIIRQIAKSFNVSIEIAESMLSVYISGKLDKDTIPKMEEVLTNVEKEWSIFFEKALLEISPDISPPTKVFITADKEVAPIYVEYLKLPKADTTSVFRKKAEIIYLDNSIIGQLYKNDSITVPDEFIGILAIFCNKILNNNS